MLRARVQAELRLCAFVASYQEPKLLNQLTNLFNSDALGTKIRIAINRETDNIGRQKYDLLPAHLS